MNKRQKHNRDFEEFCPLCHLEEQPPIRVQPVVRLIVCAAIKSKVTGRVICGARHLDEIMRDGITHGGGREEWLGAEQGFIDQFCAFVSRKDAWQIAEAAGQIRRRCGGDDGFLYSENLY